MTRKSEPLAPIAIIGIGMRLPGDISTADEFWDMLINKKDGLCPVPESRYNVGGFYKGRPGRTGLATSNGYFLGDEVNLKAFDTSFFQSNNIEVQTMDPQQRLLLEVVWECIENAGQNLQGTDTGVYIGSFGEDWQNLINRDPYNSNSYRLLGTQDFMLSNIVSHKLDLRGPS